MSKPVRLSDEVYSRLENLTDGFDTPSDTILKILNEYEYFKSYEMINGCVNAKIEIFKDEPMVELQNINILMHYNSTLVEQAICDISHANKNYIFTYEIHSNGISIKILRH